MASVSEHTECKIFAKQLKLMGIKFAKIATELRTPSIKQIMFQKAEGMTSGLPDYIIIRRNRTTRKKSLVFIEMKKKVGGTVSKAQKERGKELLECGVHYQVCKGAKEAFNYLMSL